MWAGCQSRYHSINAGVTVNNVYWTTTRRSLKSASLYVQGESKAHSTSCGRTIRYESAGQVRPVPDKYAFQATDRLTNEQTNTQTEKHRHRVKPLFCGGSLTSGSRQSKRHPAPHCRVLPPGEFNGTNADLSVVYHESFTTINVTVTVFP